MKKVILYTIAHFAIVLFTCGQLMAQARIARSEFLIYDKRDDALNDVRTKIDNHIVVKPELMFEESTGSVRAVYEQQIEVPAAWNDFNAYLHMENVGSDYAIFINGEQVCDPIDKFSPADLFISPYLEQGANTLAVVVVAEPYMERLTEGLTVVERPQFENCYIFVQRRAGVYDFNVRLLPDSLNRFGRLQLDITVDNTFTTAEELELGYDLYDPDGKLVDYSINKFQLEPTSRYTVTFKPFSYNSNQYRWSASNPKLYKLMIYVKRGGALREYIPLKVGFAKHGYNDNGEILLFDKALKLNKQTYNAAKDKATTEREIKALKAKGINCLCPEYPQPKWFYSICDAVGIYVIDCAALAAPSSADNRDVDGTPSNDPLLVEEYLMRVDAMYRRAQNHVSIIAFSLGGNISNGYNMYKAYERLKAYGDSRPIVFDGAAGEWNSDI
jgi:beta-galactosidase